jgi:hypothetical protein
VVLLVIVLSDAQHLEVMLEGFLELGLEGATVVSAQGMGEFLAQEVPIFAGMRALFPGEAGRHRVLLSVTDPAKAERAVALLQRVGGPLSARGAGIAFTVPVAAHWGLAAEF